MKPRLPGSSKAGVSLELLLLFWASLPRQIPGKEGKALFTKAKEREGAKAGYGWANAALDINQRGKFELLESEEEEGLAAFSKDDYKKQWESSSSCQFPGEMAG